MKELFGTDGIRGRAGEFPLDEPTVRIIGASLARHVGKALGRPPKFISGRDTRASGESIERAFDAGATSEGAVCHSVGVITTPGVAYLTANCGQDAGIVISASHNPYQDNGIKIFSPTGRKMDGGLEREIERDVDAGLRSLASERTVFDDSMTAQLCDRYVDHLREKAIKFDRPFKIVVDCANGASSNLAPRVFADLNAEVVTINDHPDGKNINEGCGSMYLDGLRERVLAERADVGIAFDGDADRSLFVDEQGQLTDGDATLWILARYLKGLGKLTNSMVVATVMSNIGLELALVSIGVKLLRTSVGDKYVLEKLIETGAEIGGEQSGHIIFPENSLVGDGMMTGLLVLRAVAESGASLSKLSGGFKRFPQTLINIPVREKRVFGDVPAIAAASRVIEQELGAEGRLLLRYSGTEDLARVMIEGPDQAVIEDQAKRLAAVIAETLGR